MKLKSLIKIPTYKIDKPVRLIELFGGIGAQAKSLQNLGINFEHYRYIDNDAFAVKSYNAIFDTDFKPQDIKTVHGNDLGIVDKNRYIYIMLFISLYQYISSWAENRNEKRYRHRIQFIMGS